MGGYIVQQAINAVTLGCMYGLIATGFTLVQGLVGRIHLAHGLFYMVSAFHAVIVLMMLGVLGITASFVLIPLALVFSLLATAAWGWGLYRVAYKPLARAPGYAVLMAAVGLMIAVPEAMRLVQTSDVLWLRPVLTGGIGFTAGDGFPVYLGFRNLMVIGATAAVLTGHGLLVGRSRFGRHQRACADDPEMASLLGVDRNRVIATTYAVAAGLAAIAGVFATVRYGVVSAYMGFLFGLKGFTAAVVGGIGSLPGAFLGGMIIAVLETAWTGWFPMLYRDVVVFGVLIAVLVFRPAGIFGREVLLRLPGAGGVRR